MADNKSAYKFTRDIPSPVALEYPHRNLTRIVGGIPSAMYMSDIKDRINNYFRAIQEQSIRPVPLEKRKDQTLDDFEKLQDDIALSHLEDIAPGENNPWKLMAIIANSMKISPEQQKNLYLNRVDWLGNNLGMTRGERDEGIDILLNKNKLRDAAKEKSVLFHEIIHARDRFKHGYAGTGKEYISTTRIPEGNPSAFDISNALGTTYHHVPYYDKADKDILLPAALLEPFVQVGIKDTPTFWEKMLQKVKEKMMEKKG